MVKYMSTLNIFLTLKILVRVTKKMGGTFSGREVQSKIEVKYMNLYVLYAQEASACNNT